MLFRYVGKVSRGKVVIKQLVVGIALLFSLLGNVVADELYFVHTDHLGTPKVITDDVQQTVWEIESKPFGEVDILTEDIEFNVRFPGQYADGESGLSYNYFRDYDSSTGRYVQSDPIGLAGGINTYAYVGGNPVNYVDPDGLLAIKNLVVGSITSPVAWVPRLVGFAGPVGEGSSQGPEPVTPSSLADNNSNLKGCQILGICDSSPNQCPSGNDISPDKRSYENN